jgi:type IV pilus assembly protein PilB
MQTLQDTIVKILLESKQLTKEQLDKVLEAQKKRGVPLRNVLVEQGIISEEKLLSLLSEKLFMPSLHLTKYKFDPAIIGLVPESMARLYSLIPISRMGNSLTVAMSDPLNIFALDDLKTITGCDTIDTVLSPEEEIASAIASHYRSGEKSPLDMAVMQAEAEAVPAKAEGLELSGVLKEGETPPIVQLVDLMLNQALKKRASDIHVEPEEDCLRVRYRIDGALHDIFKIPKVSQSAVLARLKIISNLDITENRIPQDGRFKVKFEQREIDFRVSSLPTTFGQKFVLRALDKSSLSMGLEKLGFSPQSYSVFKQAIAKPFGMLLVTGPTGSGKSTTLYSVLSQLNTPEKNIITIEDPVEYQIEGITQIQVKPDIGLDFAVGLRSLLRQSPDIIMVGEIRDSETADIAIKAALTGQFILSTLHTNDAISSITRLIDMGVEPFLVASSLVMLSAQRLARRICEKCKATAEVDKKLLQEIGFFAKGESRAEKTTFYKAPGCKHCNNTGFYGRIALLEAVMIDDNIREMVIRKQAIDEIRKYAVEKCGMLTLQEDAFLKVRQGLTTLEEALRITTEE